MSDSGRVYYCAHGAGFEPCANCDLQASRAENARLREALRDIATASINSMNAEDMAYDFRDGARLMLEDLEADDD